MILSKLVPSYYKKRESNTFFPPFGYDKPDQEYVNFEYWSNYPVKNYNYSFNKWAFRGEDYSQYAGRPVNICLGDSFTLNLGGPIEFSWPYQLSNYCNTPCLNLGVDGAGNDTIHMIYKWAMQDFDVQNVFVMYSFLHRRYDNKTKNMLHCTYESAEDEVNFKYFESYKIENAFFTFLPPWCWSKSELDFIKTVSIDYDNLYYNLNGSSAESLRRKLSNRDGFHLNYDANLLVANFFKKKLNAITKYD
jgi:hypothetical protein